MHEWITMRSQTKASPPQPNRTVFASIYGTVRVYTRRHINGCPLPGPDFNHCTCPKWVYSKARDGQPQQKAANTPSFTEASEQAQRTLKGFDPEIAQARARDLTGAPESVTVEAAVATYLKSVRSRNVTPGYLNALSSAFAPPRHSPEPQRKARQEYFPHGFSRPPNARRPALGEPTISERAAGAIRRAAFSAGHRTAVISAAYPSADAAKSRREIAAAISPANSMPS
jgi:hypothetical protein